MCERNALANLNANVVLSMHACEGVFMGPPKNGDGFLVGNLRNPR